MKERIDVILPRTRYRAHLEAIHYAWERGSSERRIAFCQTGCDLLTNAIGEIEVDARLAAQGPHAFLLWMLRRRRTA